VSLVSSRVPENSFTASVMSLFASVF
jgi:hypothetical protein